MATPKPPKGAVLQGPDGQVAIRMGAGVTAGKFFVLHPDRGGHYSSEQEDADIPAWPPMLVDEAAKAALEEAAKKDESK